MTATDDLNALDALDEHHHPHGDVSSSCVLCLQFDLSSVRKIECASQLIQPTKGYNPVDQQRTYEIQATLQTHKLPRLPGNGILLYKYHGQPAMSCLVTSLSFILIALGAACSGHFLAEDYVKAPSFNNFSLHRWARGPATGAVRGCSVRHGAGRSLAKRRGETALAKFHQQHWGQGAQQSPLQKRRCVHGNPSAPPKRS